MEVHCRLARRDLHSGRAAVGRFVNDLQDWAAQAAVLGASAAFGRRSLAAHQRKVSEVIRVRAAGFQDAGAWYVAVVYDFAEAGTGFVGMEEAENRRMAHSGN